MQGAEPKCGPRALRGEVRRPRLPGRGVSQGLAALSSLHPPWTASSCQVWGGGTALGGEQLRQAGGQNPLKPKARAGGGPRKRPPPPPLLVVGDWQLPASGRAAHAWSHGWTYDLHSASPCPRGFNCDECKRTRLERCQRSGDRKNVKGDEIVAYFNSDLAETKARHMIVNHVIHQTGLRRRHRIQGSYGHTAAPGGTPPERGE